MTKKSDKLMVGGLTEKVIIYTRVSSRKQVETGNGLESQEQVCREWINNQGGMVELVRVFSDGGISGKYTSRQGLDDMIEYLKEENKEYTKISKVVIDDIDRIIRDVAGWWEIKAKIEDLGGAKIFSLKQDINDTPEGKMIQSITMSVKQYERENNGRRTKDRQRGRMLNGYWCFTPLAGYKYEFDDEINKRGGKVLVLSEPNASIMKEGFELFARGVLMTISDFIVFLDQKGFTTTKGGRLKKNSDIDRVFEKEHLLFYAGYLTFPKWDVPILKAQHQPIIDDDTMDKILNRLNSIRYKTRLVNSKEKNMEELPLRGSICCEECGKHMTGAPSKSKSGKYFFYYTCRNKQCERYGKSINNNEVHTHFEEYLAKMRIQDCHLLLFEDVLKDLWSNQKESLTHIEDDREKKMDLLNKEIDKVKKRLFSTDQDSLIKIYEEKLVGLSKKMEDLENESDPEDQIKIDLPYIITNTKPILANPLLVRSIPDQKLKRMLLSLVFNNQILYNKKSGIQTPVIPLIYELLGNFGSKELLWQGVRELNPRLRFRRPLCYHYTNPP